MKPIHTFEEKRVVKYDLIVVGGGPAGSTAAKEAAKRGLNVLLIDKAKFPRVKPCAGAIRADVLDLLDFDITSVLHRKISGFSIFSPSGIRADCLLKDRLRPGYTIMRDEFDNQLLHEAKKAGVDVFEETTVVKAHQNNRNTRVETKDGNTYEASFLIGADGINSVVAKSLRFYDGWKQDTAGLALEIEVEVGESKVREICGEPSGYDADFFFMYFGNVPHGYTWCFPKRSILSLGAWCRQDKASSLREYYNEWFKQFKEEYKIKTKILSDTSARFPIRVQCNKAMGRTILIGDAAGLVDPFTGEGIPYAIESGILAATAISKALTEKNTDALRVYEQQCNERLISRLRVFDSISKMLYKSVRNLEVFIRFLSEYDYASGLVADLVGGLEKPDVVKRRLTLGMLRRKPLDAIKLVL